MPALSLDNFQDETILTRAGMNGESGFFLPISMVFLPDNRMLLASKDGEILIVDPESGANSTLMKLNNIDTGQERGLLDLTLDPDFETNGHFYLYYTPDSPEHARISRFTFQENSGGLTATANPSSEFVVWEDNDGYLSCCHYGGGLDFGPDDKLWLTTSDKFQATTPGEGGTTGGDDLPILMESSSGKIIRVNPDGSVPDGTDGQPANPWIDANDGINDYIWGYGLRNPFRARWDAEYGNMYIGEVGGNQQAIAHEDLHIATLDGGGAFYGWPFYEGTNSTYVNAGNSAYSVTDFPDPSGGMGTAIAGDFYSAPIWSLPHAGAIYDPSLNTSASLTGGEVYRGDMFPEEWGGVYFYGDYTRDYIRYLVLDETGTQVLGNYDFKPSAQLPGTTNEVVSIAVGADGALYYAMIANGEIHRVIYSDASYNEAPEITLANVAPDQGPILPLTVTFTASVIDAEDDAMTYTLNFGDGTEITNPVPLTGIISIAHDYSISGNYAISFSVADAGHTTWYAPLMVQAGDANLPPEVTTAGANPAIGDPGSTVITFSAEVFDPNGNPINYTLYFGDSNSVSGTVASGGTITETHVYAADGGYNAYFEINDGEFTDVSEYIDVQIGAPSEVPVTNGLNLLLQSDIKIGLATDNVVAAWLDGSGQGNNLFAQGNPRLEQNRTPTGEPAIVFDGIGDLLQRVDSSDTIFNLPTGNADRTMFLVVKYIDPEGVSTGLVYGDGAKNEAFGLIANASDEDLTLQSWGGSNNDFDSDVDGPTQGWMVQSVTLSSSAFNHYLNGTLIDSGTHTFATDLQKLIIGGEIAGLGASQLEVGAALIYDRALNETERMQVENFLQNKYISGNGENLPAEATDDTYAATQGTPLVIGAAQGVLVNDTDPENDPFAVIGVTVNPANGSVAMAANGSFTYTPNPGFVGTDSFTYQVTGGDTATVSINVVAGGGNLVTNGLVAAFEDENVSLGVGNTVAGWLDGSGRGNDLVSQGDPMQISGATPTGRSAIAFDGTGDLLERVNSHDTLNGLSGGSADRTMFLVVNYIDAEGVASGLVYGDGANNQAFGLTSKYSDQDLMIQGWGGSNDFDSNVDGPTQGWMVQSVTLSGNTFRHYLNGTQIQIGNHTFATDLQRIVLGGEIAGLGESQLEIGAALIYDRALTENERLEVEQYLQTKYITGTVTPNTPPVAADDSFVGAEDTVLNGNVLVDNGNGADSDADGDTLQTTLVAGPTNGTVTLNPNGTFTYTPDAAFSGTDSFTYAVSDGNGGSDQGTATITVTPSNTPADAIDDSYSTTEGMPLTVNAVQGVLANDTDAEGDPFIATGVVAGPANGLVTLNTNGSFVYAPDAGFTGTDSFTYEVTGGDTATVFINVQGGGGGGAVPVTTGLVAAFEEENVTLGAGNLVTGWTDVSGLGNNLNAAGDPTLIAGATPTGRDAIAFDGTGDLLQRVNATDTLSGLSGGDADRTMFLVVKYIDAEGVASGLVYGDGASNQAFGLTSKYSDQDLMIQGWGGKNDFDSNVDGPTQGWMVQSVTLSGNTFNHYLNGNVIQTGNHDFATDLKKLIIGGEIAGLGESELEVSAALIYNRALSTAERTQVEDYLQAKYITATANTPADAVDDSYSATEGTALVVNAANGVLANDTDAEGDPFTVTGVTGLPANGSVALNANGSFTYTPDAGFVGTDSFVYAVTGGDTATVTIDVQGGSIPVLSGLVAAFVEGNATVGAGNVVTGWSDISGLGNNLIAAGDPTLIAAATPTGRDAIAFDGTGDLLQRVNATDTLSGLPGGDADRTMFLVVNYLDAEGVASGLVYGDGAANQAFGLTSKYNDQDLMVQGWGGSNDFDSNVDGPTQGWMVQSVVLSGDTFHHYLNGDQIDTRTHDFATDLKKLIIGGEIAGLGESELEVGAALIYDRALSEVERMQVEDYLQTMYIDDAFNFA